MENPTTQDSVRPWVYWLLAAAVIGIVAVEIFRWRIIDDLRSENKTLRVQAADLETIDARNAELQDIQQELLHSQDSQSTELLQLRDELARLRAATNQLETFRMKWAQEQRRVIALEEKAWELQSKLDAKPAPPRLGAWVGISIRNAPGRQPDEPPPGGVEVMQILAHGPAAKSSLQNRDRIVAVDGEPVAGESDFKRILSQKAGGESLVFHVVRKDETVSLNVEVSDWPQ